MPTPVYGARIANPYHPGLLSEPSVNDRTAQPTRASGLTADGRLLAGKLAGLTMPAAVWALTWPILAESFLNSFVGLTDTVFSSAIDDGGASADAVGGAAYVMWIMQLVVQAVGVGATALISRAVGAGRLGVANAVVGQAAVLALACGVVVGGMIALAAGPLAAMLGLSERAAAAFRQFLYISAAGVPMGSLLFAAIACARGAGDSLRPLLTMIVVNAVNIALSWVLSGVDIRHAQTVGDRVVSSVLIHNPFDFDMGVRGIAIGTVAAYTVGCAVMLAILVRGVGGVRLRRHGVTLRRLVRLGIPNFVETLGLWAGNFVVILLVGWMGPGLLGSHLVAVRLEAFSYLPGFAFGAAGATLVGQYLGAGSPAMAARAVRACTLMACAFMGLMGLLFILAPRATVGLLTSQGVHLSLVPPVMVVAGFAQIPFALSIVLRSAIRGAGDVRAAMVITWVTTYLVRVPLAYIFSGVDIPLPGGGVIASPFHVVGGLTGLWVGLCLEIAIRAVCFRVRFAQGQWNGIRA